LQTTLPRCHTGFTQLRFMRLIGAEGRHIAAFRFKLDEVKMRILLNAARALSVSGALTLAAGAATAAEISGAGATFPFPVYAKWADAYKKETGHSVNYQSIGSGAGIKQILAKTVTFGATDAPMTAADQKKNGLVQWPMVMGGIVPVINVDGVKPGEMVLDGTTLANIFLGTVKSWDDPSIQKLNAGLKLPSTPIVVVRRSDGSGTTSTLRIICQRSVRSGSQKPVPARRSNGRWALAPRVTTVLLATSGRLKTQSATLSLLLPSKIS
jgi:ABC-type phosphate transport system substrate-binding protein